MIPLARKAKEAASTAVFDKTIIIEDTLPYGTDAAETQVYPHMEELAQNFHHESLPELPPPTPVAAWFQITIC